MKCGLKNWGENSASAELSDGEKLRKPLRHSKLQASVPSCRQVSFSGLPQAAGLDKPRPTSPWCLVAWSQLRRRHSPPRAAPATSDGPTVAFFTSPPARRAPSQTFWNSRLPSIIPNLFKLCNGA